MNIIVPIAGASSVLESTEYIKSLQEIERKTILQHAFEALQNVDAKHFVVVVKREDVNKYHLDNVVKLLRPEAEVVIAEGETMGAACTCMLAVDKLDMEKPLLIVGNDQVLTIPYIDILADFQSQDYDGGVAIFEDVHPRWSYVRINEDDHVIEAAEKRPISKNAPAGFYYFKKARFFMEAAQSMIMKGASVNGQFYICPVFNEMILKQQIIGVYRVSKEQYFNFNSTSGMDAYRNYLQKNSALEA